MERMMSFMSKKKKFKFDVKLEVEEISSVPFVNGILFAKIRLLDSSTLSNSSESQKLKTIGEEIRNNCVRWQSLFHFSVKMTASVSTGVLDPCLCRISVRRELKGGKTFDKLGYVDINLAEYAGAGNQSRRLILEGYDSKHRQANSMLKINIEMALKSGDPVFKVPTGHFTLHVPGEIIHDEHGDYRITEDCSEGSLASNSSGFGSLTRSKDRPSVKSADGGDSEFEKGHSRSASHVSHQSKGSGYGSLSHSRQSSLNENNPAYARSPSVSSELSKRKIEDSLKDRRMDSTRVDAVDLVEELIQKTDFDINSTEHSSGLQLSVDKDGKTAVW